MERNDDDDDLVTSLPTYPPTYLSTHPLVLEVTRTNQ